MALERRNLMKTTRKQAFHAVGNKCIKMWSLGNLLQTGYRSWMQKLEQERWRKAMSCLEQWIRWRQSKQKASKWRKQTQDTPMEESQTESSGVAKMWKHMSPQTSDHKEGVLLFSTGLSIQTVPKLSNSPTTIFPT